MAESLENATGFISKHKVAVGLGAAALVLWFILHGGGSSGAAGGDNGALQIAQLQAQQNVQNAQLQAQQNTAALGAQVQDNQNTDALQESQDELAAQIAATAYAANTQNTQTNAQSALYDELISTGAQEQEQQLNSQTTLSEQLIPKLDSQHYGSTNLNALALVLGQGNIGSFNSANSSENIASTLEQGSIIKSITGGATSLLGGLF